MPTYVYRREDGSTFEIEQRMVEDALTSCPTTGQSVKRVITGGTGVIFKGTGFYQTDYVKKSGVPEKPSETASASDAKATAAKPKAEPASTPDS